MRLSKDDGDKAESESISNQRKLLKDMQKIQELKLIKNMLMMDIVELILIDLNLKK